MAGSITEVKVWPVKKEGSKLLANGQFIYDGAFKIRFRLIKGSNGPFVGYAGNYGNKKDENGKTIFYAEVSCLDEGVRTELNQAVMHAYNTITGNTESINQGEAAGPTNQTVSSQNSIKKQIPF